MTFPLGHGRLDALPGVDRSDAGRTISDGSFTQLAKYLERTDVTCRIIQTKYDILKTNEQATRQHAAQHSLDGGAAKLLLDRSVSAELSRRYGPARGWPGF